MTLRSSQWPSKGGTGSKLKIAKTRFIKTMKEKSSGKSEASKKVGRNLKIKPKIKAIKMFEAGPANPTLAGPNL